MTPEAKRLLSNTIRGLRTRLLKDLHDEVVGTYRLSVRAQDAGLAEAERARRARLDRWLDEQVRGEADKGKRARSREDFLSDVVKLAAATLLNRIIFLRLLEAAGLRSPKVVTGGWNSRGYQDFHQVAIVLTRGEHGEGYEFLLRLVFEDLAQELPGLYGAGGIADLVPVPVSTLRHLVETLDDQNLESCWTDDMTLGWVYQYWNDPEREALDEKLNHGGKIEPHEIASKTQMFTERYMVDWLLQNSLGPMWLAMCRKHGWTAEVEADGTLNRLEARRTEWRVKREAGEVSLTNLMPLETDSERRWAYYLPQPIPEDAVRNAPETVRDLKILDPAVGSGHFLVVAFDLLTALYWEEARHRSEVNQEHWSDCAIVERILEHNLHGIDLDPRAVQIAAAALWLKAKQICGEARPGQINLVASNLRLGSLPDDDPALVELRQEVERETGIPAMLTDTVVHALKGADYLGSLLKISAAVDQALDRHEKSLIREGDPVQLGIFGRVINQQQRLPLGKEEVRVSLLDRLEIFLARHTSGEDLGLRLRGEQFAAGVRFIQIVQEGKYDLVIGNPPYQLASKLRHEDYIKRNYRLGKADLYAAFLDRSLQLARDGGWSALLTMRGWMFIRRFCMLRDWLLSNYDMRVLGDFDRGAFEEVPDEIVAVVGSVFCKIQPTGGISIALQPIPLEDQSRDNERTQRKRAAVLCQAAVFSYSVVDLDAVQGRPVLYWWTDDLRGLYRRSVKIGEVMESRVGLRTSDNARFIRRWWEPVRSSLTIVPMYEPLPPFSKLRFVPHVMGASGRSWFEQVSHSINWSNLGLEVCVALERAYGAYPQSTEFYFLPAVAFPKIGARFSGRAVLYRSTIDVAAPCVFPERLPSVVCLFNRKITRDILRGISPTINFQPGDIARLPLIEDSWADAIYERLLDDFREHEVHREPSIEFRFPGPSAWNHAQEWAQAAVDRPEGAPLPFYKAEYEREPATDHLSFALGGVLGRFNLGGSGIIDSAIDDLYSIVPNAILFLDGSLEINDWRDGLGCPQALPLVDVWNTYGSAIDPGGDLRSHLRTKFFDAVHRMMYENRPIYWPLSSEDRTFVAWVNIHRWTGNTLRILLADHLVPALARLEGTFNDLRDARDSADKKAAREAERRLERFRKWREELIRFIALVRNCAENGPTPTDAQCKTREVDARYEPDLDDGVMINSAALWPLLMPQWKDPKKWWKELANAEGKKDYDWSYLAMRYWPTRVDKKCQGDPSLGVAHGCFWKYHPARAWAWELRLQDEIGPDFRIDEGPYRGDAGSTEHRIVYLRDYAKEALEIVEKEALRRRRKHKRPQRELHLLEVGLWAAHPELCWELEVRVSEKQGVEFFLRAPDEPEARAAFEAAHPNRTREREELVASLETPTDLFEDEEESEGDGEELEEDDEA
ncbi:MAG TPA: BREX-6 system adenine-specific DNA-methyltransferase PglX [Thermoanaerobaculia bacterium]|jgi:hypothetical protein|nr:BREX-6 system adenine-specific DNA-methyltransferase PglX [Thermoanaerobaculia bacterium]